MNEIWIEKYRPKSLDDVVGQTEVTRRLKSYVKTRNMPHLLFAGPAGTGKTTCAIALAREFFGETWKQNFRELNASDERGIEVVRGAVKNFARTASIGEVPFKIIFLDEADALTAAAQAALRRTMERYTNTCRFIISCNYSSKLIDPIQSRCAVFRFRPVKSEDVASYINMVVKEEKKEITDEALEAIIYIGQGDLRKATNVLQVAASIEDKVDANAIYESASLAKPDDIKELVSIALSGKFVEARTLLEDLLITYALSGEDIIKQIHRVVFDLPINDRTKVELVDKIGEIEYRLIEGGSERIQLESLLAYFGVIGQELK